MGIIVDLSSDFWPPKSITEWQSIAQLIQIVTITELIRHTFHYHRFPIAAFAQKIPRSPSIGASQNPRQTLVS
jgi:hypothetical protein